MTLGAWAVSHGRVRRLLGWWLSLWLCTASVAAAQAPDSDQIFSPLIDQAESDQRASRLVEARARARAVLGRVSAGSPLAARANAVLQVAEAATGAAEPSLEVVFEPLVIAAEADGAAGRNALALARLSAAMALVPADSPLAARARNVYAMVSRAPGTPAPQVITPAPQPAAPAPQPQVIVVTQAPAPAPSAAPSPAAMVAPKTVSAPPPVDPERRRAAEIAELRLAGGALGLLAGVYTLTLLNADDPLLFLTIPLFTTAAGVLAVGALDSDEGMRSGVPAAISTGVLAGFGDGLLIWGVARNRVESGKGILSIITGATAAGAVVGGLFGYGLRPTIAESRFVLSAGVWGLWIGLMGSLGVDASADGVWTGTMVAYNVGLGAAMVIASVTDVSMERLAFSNGSLAVGALLGLMIAGIVIGEAKQDDEKPSGTIVPMGLAIGSAIGLLAGLAIPEDDLDRDSSSAFVRTLVDLDLDLSVMPVRGGATFGFVGKL